MTVDDAAARLEQLLVNAGFDRQNPDPALAWKAFRQFAVEPLELETAEIWFEASGDDPAYFDFVRSFTFENDDAAWDEHLTAHFTTSSQLNLGTGEDTIHAEDLSDLAAWFAEVEASPVFKAGLVYRGWAFEVRIDGG